MFIRLLIVSILLGILGIAPNQHFVQAQSMPCGVNYTWVSVAGSPDYISFYNTNANQEDYIPLTRGDNSDIIPSTPFVENQFKYVAQVYETPWVCTASLVQMHWKRDNVSSANASIQTSMDGFTWEVQSAGLSNNTIAVSTSASTTRLLTWTNPLGVSYRYIRLRVSSSAPRIMSMVIVGDDVSSQYIKPLAPSDQLSMTENDVNTVVARANSIFAPVHSGISGAVAISTLTTSDCDALGYPNCVIEGDGLSMVNSHKVVVNGDIALTYLVHNASQYVVNGSSISAGCVLGETMVGSTLNGVALLNAQDELLTSLTVNPTTSIPCNAVPSNNEGACLNEAVSGSNWYRQGDVTGSNPIVLGVGGKIYQMLSLPQNVQARMTVRASAGNIVLKLGNTSASHVTYTDLTVSIDWGLHTPNVVDFWEASVQNKGSSPVTIYDICVQIEDPGNDENGDGIGGNVQPSNCYFVNHTFSQGLEGWAVNDGVLEDEGQIFLSNNGGVSQPVKLYADGSKDYTLTVEFELWYGGAYTPDYNDDANEIVIRYSYPYDDNADSNSFVDFDALTFGHVLDNAPKRHSITITLTDDVDADMFISVSIDTVAGVRGIALNRVCLSPNDGEWTGYDATAPVPFTEHCEIIPPPQGNDISRWISWHWHNLSQFFQCDLMATLNNTYGLLRWFQTLMFIFFQWLTNDLIMWVGGHMDNIIYAISNPQNTESLYVLPGSISNGDAPESLFFAQNISTPLVDYEDCPWYDVFCHGRNMLDTFGGVADSVGNAVAAIIRFIGALLMQIIDLILWGFKQFWGAVQEVYNNFATILEAIRDFIDTVTELINEVTTLWNEAEPLAPPGTDTCTTNPEDKIICLIYWVLESTVFSGEYGSLIVPLMVSVIGIIGFLILSNRFVGLVKSARHA